MGVKWPAAVAVMVAGALGVGAEWGDDPSPMRLAGHGATCSDGYDNDYDGRADAADIDDCFNTSRPGHPADHHEDENAHREQRPRGAMQPTAV